MRKDGTILGQQTTCTRTRTRRASGGTSLEHFGHGRAGALAHRNSRLNNRTEFKTGQGSSSKEHQEGQFWDILDSEQLLRCFPHLSSPPTTQVSTIAEAAAAQVREGIEAFNWAFFRSCKQRLHKSSATEIIQPQNPYGLFFQRSTQIFTIMKLGGISWRSAKLGFWLRTGLQTIHIYI